jgi:hypothetical protein
LKAKTLQNNTKTTLKYYGKYLRNKTPKKCKPRGLLKSTQKRPLKLLGLATLQAPTS